MIQQHSSDSTPLSEDNADVDESCSKENDDNNSVDSEGAKNENNVFDDMLETLLQPLSRRSTELSTARFSSTDVNLLSSSTL